MGREKEITSADNERNFYTHLTFYEDDIFTIHSIFWYSLVLFTFLAESGVEPAAEPVLLVPGGLAVAHHHNLVGFSHLGTLRENSVICCGGIPSYY
jgi:hypothetical protein